MFKSFGLPELLIILVIVLLIFGAGKLPQIGGAIGKSIKEFKKEKASGQEKAEEKEKAPVQAAQTSSPTAPPAASQTEKKEAKG